MDRLSSENKFAIMPEWVIGLNISHTAFRLYAVLARYADNVTHQAFPSLDTLSSRLNCSEKTVRRAIDDLVKHGAIRKHSRGRYQSSVYTVMTSAPDGTKVSPIETEMSDEGTKVSTRLDTDDQVTITTELEPLERKPLNDIGVTDFDLKFTEWWSVYPNRKGKGAAKSAYKKALKKVSHDVLVASAEQYRDDPNREDKYTPYPQKWLNEERWDDSPQPAPVRKRANWEDAADLARKYRETEQPAIEYENETIANEIATDAVSWLKGVDDD